MGPLLHPSSQHLDLSSAVSHSAHTMASSALTLMLVFACLIAASQAFYGYGLYGMGMPFGGYGMMGGYGLMPFYGGFGGYGGYGMGMYGRYYWTAVDFRSAVFDKAAD